MAEHAPRITFGIPVRNEALSITRCLDSILAQDFQDFEVIVSDNASTDSTREVVLEYSARDSRIRLYALPQNMGVIENFNHCARLARGEMFRWIGADDWIETNYASECLAALDLHPEAIAATTYFDLERDKEDYEYIEYKGEMMESPNPVRRLDRMLWLIQQGPGIYEPIYCLMRRKSLIETGLLRIHRKNDWLMSAQLSLAGRFVHVDQRLFHRWWPLTESRQRDLAKKLHPVRHRELESSSRKLFLGLLSVIAQADLCDSDRRACRRVVARYCAIYFGKKIMKTINRFRRQRLGLSREALRAFFG